MMVARMVGKDGGENDGEDCVVAVARAAVAAVMAAIATTVVRTEWGLQQGRGIGDMTRGVAASVLA